MPRNCSRLRWAGHVAILATIGVSSLSAQQSVLAGQISPDLDPETQSIGREGEGRSTWSRLRALPREFASDTWAATTAPLRLRGDDAWVFAGVLGVAGVMYLYDQDILDSVIRRREREPWETVEDLGEFFEPMALMGKTNPYYAAGIVVGSLAGWGRMERISKELLFSHWIAALTRRAVGAPIGRERPVKGYGPHEFNAFEGSSFPSGHSSTAAQVAAVLSHHIGWWPATLALHAAAASVVYQRVAGESHWTSDAWIGAAWGWGVAQVVIRRRERGRSEFVPILNPSTGAVGLSVEVDF